MDVKSCARATIWWDENINNPTFIYHRSTALKKTRLEIGRSVLIIIIKEKLQLPYEKIRNLYKKNCWPSRLKGAVSVQHSISKKKKKRPGFPPSNLKIKWPVPEKIGPSVYTRKKKKFKPRRPAATALAFAAEVRLFNPSTHAKAVNKKIVYLRKQLGAIFQ